MPEMMVGTVVMELDALQSLGIGGSGRLGTSRSTDSQTSPCGNRQQSQSDSGIRLFSNQNSLTCSIWVLLVVSLEWRSWTPTGVSIRVSREALSLVSRRPS